MARKSENQEQEGASSTDEQLETSESLRDEIATLQTKLAALESEDEPEVEPVIQPLADCLVKIEKNTEIWRYGITPAEVQLLVAEHHQQAGEMPIIECRPRADTVAKLNAKLRATTDDKEKAGLEAQLSDPRKSQTTLSCDPRELKNYLIGRSTAEKVEKLYPGAEPTFPKTFKRAMQLGLSHKLPDKGLFEMEMTSSS